MEIWALKTCEEHGLEVVFRATYGCKPRFELTTQQLQRSSNTRQDVDDLPQDVLRCGLSDGNAEVGDVVSCDKLKNFVVHFGSTTSIIFSFIFIISPLMVHVMKMAILCQIWAFLGPRPLYHHEVVGFVGKQYADGPTPIISIFWVNKHPLPSHLRVGF